MIIKNKRNKKLNGLTLLEVLVSIIILAGTLMAFAMSFPTAFQVGRKSSNAVRASKYAAAIAEELRTLPSIGTKSMSLVLNTRDKAKYIEAYESTASGGYLSRTAQNLMDKSNICSYLKSVQDMKSDGDHGLNKNGALVKYGNSFFSLDGSPSKLAGIVVEHTGSHTWNADSQFWQIIVTVSWPENMKSRTVRKSTTVITAKAGNRW